MKKRLLALCLCLVTMLTLLPITAAAKTPLQITKQPPNRIAAEGKKVSTYVVAKGDGLKYQWYVQNPGQRKFYKSSITQSTYTFTMTQKHAGRKVYCVVTDRYGNSVTSKTVTLKMPTALQILQQPDHSRVTLGTTASTKVTAKGDGLQYQWYYRNANGSTYKKSSITTDTYRVKMTPDKSGRRVYCVITDRYGNTMRTQTVKLSGNGSFAQTQYKVNPGGKISLSQDFAFQVNDTFTWKSSNSSVAKVDANGVVTGVKNGTVTITATSKTSSIQARCKVTVCAAKQVAITFDDGPSIYTSRLLDYLEDTDVKVTFFIVGDRINAYRNTLARAAQQGHEIGYHSYSHQIQTNLSDSQITEDFKKSNKLLKSITGQEFTLWRTPGGGYSTRVLECVPLPHILWSVDTRDWSTRNSASVYSSIVNSAKDGSIILLHDLYETSVDGAIRAIKKLRQNGYEFVTVTELLSRKGTPPKNHATYYYG